jgi:hypothetical protein
MAISILQRRMLLCMLQGEVLLMGLGGEVEMLEGGYRYSLPITFRLDASQFVDPCTEIIVYRAKRPSPKNSSKERSR